MMPRPAFPIVNGPAPACTLRMGGRGAPSLPAGNFSRAHIRAAPEYSHCCNRPARRLRKEST